MSQRTELVEAFLATFKTVTGATDQQAIKVDANGPRPALPYVTVSATGPGRIDSRETIRDLDGSGDPRERQRTQRTAEVVLVEYGDGDLIDDFVQRLGNVSALEACETNGVSIEPDGQPIYGAVDRGTGREPVQTQRFMVQYSYTQPVADAETLTAVDYAEVALSLDRYTDDPDGLDVTVTLSTS